MAKAKRKKRSSLAKKGLLTDREYQELETYFQVDSPRAGDFRAAPVLKRYLEDATVEELRAELDKRGTAYEFISDKLLKKLGERSYEELMSGSLPSLDALNIAIALNERGF